MTGFHLCSLITGVMFTSVTRHQMNRLKDHTYRLKGGRHLYKEQIQTHLEHQRCILLFRKIIQTILYKFYIFKVVNGIKIVAKLKAQLYIVRFDFLHCQPHCLTFSCTLKGQFKKIKNAYCSSYL